MAFCRENILFHGVISPKIDIWSFISYYFNFCGIKPLSLSLRYQKAFFIKRSQRKGGGGSREVEDVHLVGQEYTAVGEFSAFRSKFVYFENFFLSMNVQDKEIWKEASWGFKI